MKPTLPGILVLLCAVFRLSAGGLPDPDAVFQYALPVDIANREGVVRSHMTHLWVPAASARLRGLVVMGETSLENPISRDPAVRAACERQDLGILFAKASVASLELAEILERYAEVSGLEELTRLPYFFVGHSAGGPAARSMAIRHAENCFGLMLSRGGGPMGDPAFPVEIPVLMIVGQFDEFGGVMRTADGRENAWEAPMEALIRHKQANPDDRTAMAVEAGAGHFSWSEKNAGLFALFLEKAAAQGLPPRGEHAPLRRVDTAGGVRVPLNLRDEKPFGAAESSWLMDAELAEAFRGYHSGLRKRDQFVEWGNRHWIEAGARVYFHEIEWVEDGSVFQTRPVFGTRYPDGGVGEGKHWPQVGEAVGHARTPLRVRAVTGPLETLDNHRIRLRPSALSPMEERLRNSFLAYNEGDEEYRYTERVGMLPRTFRGLREGREQRITFAVPDAPGEGGGAVALHAESDAGLPVRFYVARGPAVVRGDTLILREIPTRSKRPIEIEVVAYQVGSGLEPKVRSAVPVSHILQLP